MLAMNAFNLEATIQSIITDVFFLRKSPLTLPVSTMAWSIQECNSS